MRLSFVFIIGLISLVQNTNALVSDKTSHYYGADFLGKFQSGQLKNQDLLNSLHVVLKNAHIKQSGMPDIIVSSCDTSEAVQKKCEQHTALGYDRARKIMFGSMDLEKLSDGTYTVRDVYCEKNFTNKDFGSEGHIGPGLIPGNGAILNTEHTWPQSRFTGRFNKEMQKSDLHHLYPTDSEMNSRRSSFRFGYVADEIEKLKCSQNRLGRQETDKSTVFEPPVNHRGNVARAIFYFATRYQMKISPEEQKALKEWNKADPVDDIEIKRNNMIENAQGNRNPFVDYPEMIDAISNFSFETSN